MFIAVLVLILLVAAAALFFVGKVDGFGYNNDKTVNFRPFALIPFGLALLLLFFGSLKIVDPGKVAIPVAFGNAGAPVGPGVHFMPPWVDVKSFSIRTEEYTMSASHDEGNKQGDDSVEVKGADGATGHIDSTVLYSLNKGDASAVYKTLGTDYLGKLIRPTIRTCIRDGYATTSMVEAATTKRGAVEATIADCIGKTFGPQGFTLQSVQIRNVGLEAAVQQSVDAKVASQQAAQQKQFELAAATQDAEKTRIQAQATADGQQIIKCGAHLEKVDGQPDKVVPNPSDNCDNKLTPEYLQWFYIDMMSKIVQSPNHDTVIIPSGQTINPIINTNGG